MQKTPTYFGIFVSDKRTAQKQIRNYVRQGIAQLLQIIKQPELTELIHTDLNNFQVTFKPPADNYHITTLFTGGNVKKLNQNQNKMMENFQVKKKASLKMNCIIYIPGYILSAYCSDTEGIQVDNKFPHVTLFLGHGAKAVQSNIVIEALALKNPDLFVKKQFKTAKYDFQFSKFKNVYIINKGLQLEGVTGNNFTHGKR